MEKQRCPHCGSIVSKREIALYRGLITALFRVFKWVVQRNNGHTFTRKDIKHLLKNENDTARFGDLVMFGGLVYKPSKANYGLHMQRCEDFFRGNYKIPMRVWKDPLTGMLTPEDYKTIREIPSIMTLLDADGFYISRYKPNADLFGGRDGQG